MLPAAGDFKLGPLGDSRRSASWASEPWAALGDVGECPDSHGWQLALRGSDVSGAQEIREGFKTAADCRSSTISEVKADARWNRSRACVDS
jgi:hypothetical protein